MAFRDVLAPLKSFAQVQFRPWDGSSPLDVKEDVALPMVFCMLKPPTNLMKAPGAKVVWMPMWDWVWGTDQVWWDTLPKSLRVLAFSNPVAYRAQAAGLDVLHLRFFKKREALEPARWENGRILFHWNRTGLVSPKLLGRFCEVLDIRKLLFLPKTDPHRAKYHYSLPSMLGKTAVETLPDFMPRDRFLEVSREANIFLAPRTLEGIGMSFLEALARGCAVFAYNASTMNEYIRHRESGYLWATKRSRQSEKLEQASTIRANGSWHSLGMARLSLMGGALRRRVRRLIKEEEPIQIVEDHQDWQEISRLDLQALGNAALHHYDRGVEQWEERIPELAKFMLDWST